MEIQCSSLKNETVIFIIPHTIKTITIHVFKIISSIIPNYFQNSFNRDTLISDGWKPHLVFEHVITTSHFIRKINENELTNLILKGFKDFRVKYNEIN